MPEYTDTLEPDSEFFEKCARHTARQTARSLQHIYLCDDCAHRFVHEAFNDRPPLYHGETIEGFCGLCNDRLEVTLRQWFVCQVCWNVVVAYQKSFVAAASVTEFWNRDIHPHFPQFSIEETEEVYLLPYVRGAKTKKQGAAELEDLDFLVSEEVGGDVKPAFHIELKSGPGSIEAMTEFQLDVNDFNDIAGAINNTKLPAYIVHVQLAQEYDPPTRRTVAAAIWWTDPERLRAHLKTIKKRRGEDKQAAYFEPEAFRPWPTFREEMAARGFEALAEAVNAAPVAFID